MSLRRDDTCVVCQVALPSGSRARWDSTQRTVTCLSCVGQPEPERDPVIAAECEPAIDAEQAVTTTAIDAGTAGASAQREYERRQAKEEQRVRTRYPRIGGLILALSDEPQSTTAWAKGAVGERKLGQRLDALRSERVIVLHDRKVPGTRANIDHVVIASSGIHVIDAKRYTGRVEIRNSGGFFRRGPDLLYVGGRNQTRLVEKMAGQVDVVRGQLDGYFPAIDLDAIIRPSLCFVEAEWGLFAKPMTLQGVRIFWPKALIPAITEAGPLEPDQVIAVGTRLAEKLVPA